MLIPIKSRSRLKLGHVGSKTRSLGHILDKPSVHSSGHSLKQKSKKICQNVNSHKSKSGSKLGHVGSKTRSGVQVIKNLVYTREGTVLTKSS